MDNIITEKMNTLFKQTQLELLNALSQKLKNKKDQDLKNSKKISKTEYIDKKTKYSSSKDPFRDDTEKLYNSINEYNNISIPRFQVHDHNSFFGDETSFFKSKFEKSLEYTSLYTLIGVVVDITGQIENLLKFKQLVETFTNKFNAFKTDKTNLNVQITKVNATAGLKGRSDTDVGAHEYVEYDDFAFSKFIQDNLANITKHVDTYQLLLNSQIEMCKRLKIPLNNPCEYLTTENTHLQSFKNLTNENLTNVYAKLLKLPHVLNSYYNVVLNNYTFALLNKLKEITDADLDHFEKYLEKYKNKLYTDYYKKKLKEIQIQKVDYHCRKCFFNGKLSFEKNEVIFDMRPEQLTNQETDMRKTGESPISMPVENEFFKFIKKFLFSYYYKPNRYFKYKSPQSAQSAQSDQSAQSAQSAQSDQSAQSRNSSQTQVSTEPQTDYTGYFFDTNVSKGLEDNLNQIINIHKIIKRFNIIKTNYEYLYGYGDTTPITTEELASREINLFSSIIVLYMDIKVLRENVNNYREKEKTTLSQTKQRFLCKVIDIIEEIQKYIRYGINISFADKLINDFIAKLNDKKQEKKEQQDALAKIFELANELKTSESCDVSSDSENTSNDDVVDAIHQDLITSTNTNEINIKNIREHVYKYIYNLQIKLTCASFINTNNRQIPDDRCSSIILAKQEQQEQQEQQPQKQQQKELIKFTKNTDDKINTKINTEYNSPFKFNITTQAFLKELQKKFERLDELELTNKNDRILFEVVKDKIIESPRKKFLYTLGAIFVVNSDRNSKVDVNVLSNLYKHPENFCPVSSFCKVCFEKDFFKKAFETIKIETIKITPPTNPISFDDSSFDDYVLNFIRYNPIPYHKSNSICCPWYQPSKKKPASSSANPRASFGVNPRANPTNPRENPSVSSAFTGYGQGVASATWNHDPQPASQAPNANNNNNNNASGGSRHTKRKVKYTRKTKTRLLKTIKKKKYSKK
jgi:hypothetical protein